MAGMNLILIIISDSISKILPHVQIIPNLEVKHLAEQNEKESEATGRVLVYYKATIARDVGTTFQDD